MRTSYALVWLLCESYSSTGARYLRRGVDKDGFVGNFVETEMVSSVLRMREKLDASCICVCVCVCVCVGVCPHTHACIH